MIRFTNQPPAVTEPTSAKKNAEAHRFRAIMRDGGLRSRYLQKRLQASGPAHAAFRRLTQHPQVAAVFDKYKVRQRDLQQTTMAMKPVLELYLDDPGLLTDKDDKVSARSLGGGAGTNVGRWR